MPEPRIVEKPVLRVVGFEAPFISVLSPDATNVHVIGPLWNKLLERVQQVGARNGDAMYGIVYGRPEKERTHPHELLYLAGVPVNQTAEVPAEMTARTIPAGTFAVFTHRGSIKTIGDTVSAIYRVWLPQSGYQHARIADVELYDQRFCVDSAESEMEIWISVTRKGP